jgi:hypothetical protein
MASKFSEFASKMKAEGLSDAAIAAFEYSYNELVSGNTGMIQESDIVPVETLPDLDADIKRTSAPDPSLLKVYK